MVFSFIYKNIQILDGTRMNLKMVKECSGWLEKSQFNWVMKIPPKLCQNFLNCLLVVGAKKGLQKKGSLSLIF